MIVFAEKRCVRWTSEQHAWCSMPATRLDGSNSNGRQHGLHLLAYLVTLKHISSSGMRIFATGASVANLWWGHRIPVWTLERDTTIEDASSLPRRASRQYAHQMAAAFQCVSIDDVDACVQGFLLIAADGRSTHSCVRVSPAGMGMSKNSSMVEAGLASKILTYSIHGSRRRSGQ